MSFSELDNREPCKYGENCYQKNPKHHERFKHPKKINEKENLNADSSPPSKKKKQEDREFSSPAKCSLSSEESKEDSLNDEILLPPSPSKIEDNIKQKFLLEMPKDFYDFWSFCTSLNEQNPEDALLSVGLRLVGPFDLMSGKLKKMKDRRLTQYLCHWRYYYDPPEFQTVIAGNEKEFHMGYYRDDPFENPVFVASMNSVKPGVIQPMKEDLICSVYNYLRSLSTNSDDQKYFVSKLKDFASNHGYKYETTTLSPALRARNKKVVAKTFHGAGIVVPFNKETDVGYREIPETNADLKRIMKKISEAPDEEQKKRLFDPLHELMTNAQWATDEGDFGMGLELGLDLFTFGSPDFHPYVRHLLTVAYDLLNRQPFGEIIKAHLSNRRRGSNMSSI